MSPETVERSLETESGLLGISGHSGDLRELQSAAEAGDERSGLAIDVYLHRLCGSIAAMASAMGGFDALAFTGGVGEGSASVYSGRDLPAARSSGSSWTPGETKQATATIESS